MVVRVSDPIIIKIDADIEDARRKLTQLKKEAEGTAHPIRFANGAAFTSADAKALLPSLSERG